MICKSYMRPPLKYTNSIFACSYRKGDMSMEDFITKVSILKDALAATGEGLKESEIILITLGALGDEYESFVTSITTR